MNGLRSLGLMQACLLAAAVGGAVAGTRLAYVHLVPSLLQAIHRRREGSTRWAGARQRMPIAWGGVRGAVSLAAALAVPEHTADGAALADRDVVVFTTAAVIAGTLLIQGQTLPRVIRWARLEEDLSEADEERLARKHVVETALTVLPAHAARLGATPDVAARVERELNEQVRLLGTDKEPAHHIERDLRQALLDAKRSALVDLRDGRRIDDTVLRRVQETLDTEEVWLARREAAARSRSRLPAQPSLRADSPAEDG
ncbi:cation:proton antiporter [Streptomyces bobili]|uniref:cation:proton antiporter domain-containing protein n=1 Tax=Streptomyces bobili TaxID=67280 RepID=UPI003429E142